jgi:hypothetical protein
MFELVNLSVEKAAWTDGESAFNKRVETRGCVS